jgi:transcription termination factor NusB
MTLKERLYQDHQFTPIHTRGFSNHLPMATIALYKMNAPEESMDKFRTHYTSRYKLEIMEKRETIDEWEDYLGRMEYYESYVEYFQNGIKKSGRDAVLTKTLNRLVDGLGSFLFHGLIRVSYACMTNSDDELARALASFASAYEAHRYESTMIEQETIEESIHGYIKNREGLFHLEGDVKKRSEAMIEAFLDLYISTGSFIVLHTITGLQAFLHLLSYYKDQDQALNEMLLAMERALLRISVDDYKKVALDKVHSLTELKELAFDIQEAHTIKFVYSLSWLNQYMPDERYKLAGSIKLKLDHNM